MAPSTTMDIFVILTLLTLESAVRAKTCTTYPKIWSTDTKSVNDELVSNYGDDVTLLCFANRPLFNNDVDLTDTINNTTVQLTVRKPDVGRHEYRCTDAVTQCEASLRLSVLPAMVVTSPHALLDGETGFAYFVPNGDVYKVFCSANNIESLTLTVAKKSLPLPLKTQTFNRTTVVYGAAANDTSDYYYSCKYNEVNTFVIVKIDYAPEARDFDCILHESLRLECFWTTSSKKNSDKLWFQHLNPKRETLLCAHNPGEIAKSCSANLNLRDVAVLDLNVRFESCNQVGCNNQTFKFHAEVITKFDAPVDLKVSNMTSNSVVLTWSTRGFVTFKKVEFKVEYRLLETDWQLANTSAVVCQLFTCDYLLHLPCSDMHYEVRVSSKFRKPVGRFWSEPSASKYFFTEPKVMAAVDQVCHVALQEPDPISSAETALIEINKLIRHTIKDNRSLKEKITALKRKATKVRSLRMLDEL